MKTSVVFLSIVVLASISFAGDLLDDTLPNTEETNVVQIEDVVLPSTTPDSTPSSLLASRDNNESTLFFNVSFCYDRIQDHEETEEMYVFKGEYDKPLNIGSLPDMLAVDAVVGASYLYWGGTSLAAYDIEVLFLANIHLNKSFIVYAGLGPDVLGASSYQDSDDEPEDGVGVVFRAWARLASGQCYFKIQGDFGGTNERSIFMATLGIPVNDQTVFELSAGVHKYSFDYSGYYYSGWRRHEYSDKDEFDETMCAIGIKNYF